MVRRQETTDTGFVVMGTTAYGFFAFSKSQFRFLSHLCRFESILVHYRGHVERGGLSSTRLPLPLAESRNNTGSLVRSVRHCINLRSKIFAKA